MSEEEINQTTDLLKKLNPGFLPYSIFEQVARIAAMPVVEIIPLKLNAMNEVEVLLIDRGADDPLWPNMLHTPGTIIRADDLHEGETHDRQAFWRIMHNELKDTSVSTPHYVGSIFHQSKRGAEQAQLYWVEITGELQVGSLYSVADLPRQLIDSQAAFISRAAKAFFDYKTAEQSKLQP